MSVENNDIWRLKQNAFLCRLPGQVMTGDEQSRLADAVAFGWDALDAALSTDAAPYLLHPLTRERHDLPDYGAVDWKSVYDETLRHAEAIIAQYPNNPKAAYLALWRWLPEPLPASAEAFLRRYWRLLPADVRYPTRLLWDHQSMVSALVGIQTANGSLRPALLQFNIADTQPFVTRARRTQDLWAGSYILSFLCWQMLRYFADRFGPDCVLSPTLRGQPLADLWLQELGVVAPNTKQGWIKPDDERLMIANIPNIFTVLVPESEMESAARGAINAALKKWKEISDTVKEQIKTAAASKKIMWDDYAEQLWDGQSATFLRDNIFWAGLPLPSGRLTEKDMREWLTDHRSLLSRDDVFTGKLAAVCNATPDDAMGGLLYGSCSEAIARALSDTKRFRNFAQVDEPGQKCTLMGTLSAVSVANASLASTRKWWNDLATVEGGNGVPKMAGRIRPGDQLCAIAATKRLAMQAYFENNKNKGEPRFNRHQYPSTAGIANSGVIQSLIRATETSEGVREAIKHYVEAITVLANGDNLNADLLREASALGAWVKEAGDDPVLQQFVRIEGDCLNPEFYDAERLLNEFSRVPTDDALNKAKDARRALFAFGSKEIVLPTPYYAIIAMDGDSMGSWVSGREHRKYWGKDRPLTASLHQAFTAALSGFALGDVRRIIEQKTGAGRYAGKLIYAGGDDVLALLPVADLLETMNELYVAFRGEESPVGTFSGFVERNGVYELRLGRATLSAGAVIVHQNVPLGFALEQAREAEQSAKTIPDGRKDAFAIRLLRRSGAPLEAVSHWRHRHIVDGTEKCFCVTEVVRGAATLMQGKVVSSRLPYALAESRLGEFTTERHSPADLAAMRRSEFRRIVSRQPMDASLKNKDYHAFIEQFSALVAAEEDGAWDTAVNLLRIARALSTGGAPDADNE